MAGAEAREGDLSVDADIRRASTLPGSFYRDPETFESLRREVFPRTWQWVADADQIKTPGQVYPFRLLPGFLDEPLVLVRDEADEVRCLSNVCTHRAALVVEAPGRLRHLRCRYHGRRFGLDGRFQHMPECEAAEDFPSESDHLPRVASARWGPLQFVSLEPAAPFDELMADLERRFGWWERDHLTFDAGRSRDYLVQAHWALYCDNYLEGFHIPFVHQGLDLVLDYGSYRTESFVGSSFAAAGCLQIGVAASGEEAFELPPDHPDSGERIAAYYYWLFPNTMLNFYPWGLSLNVVQPLGPERTKVAFRTYVLDPSKLDRGAGAGLDRVEREDEEVVESVQLGVSSRLYRRGRFSPTRESGVHHFHRLLDQVCRSPGGAAS